MLVFAIFLFTVISETDNSYPLRVNNVNSSRNAMLVAVKGTYFLKFNEGLVDGCHYSRFYT